MDSWTAVGPSIINAIGHERGGMPVPHKHLARHRCRSAHGPSALLICERLCLLCLIRTCSPCARRRRKSSRSCSPKHRSSRGGDSRSRSRSRSRKERRSSAHQKRSRSRDKRRRSSRSRSKPRRRSASRDRSRSAERKRKSSRSRSAERKRKGSRSRSAERKRKTSRSRSGERKRKSSRKDKDKDRDRDKDKERRRSSAAGDRSPKGGSGGWCFGTEGRGGEQGDERAGLMSWGSAAAVRNMPSYSIIEEIHYMVCYVYLEHCA